METINLETLMEMAMERNPRNVFIYIQKVLDENPKPKEPRMVDFNLTKTKLLDDVARYKNELHDYTKHAEFELKTWDEVFNFIKIHSGFTKYVPEKYQKGFFDNAMNNNIFQDDIHNLLLSDEQYNLYNALADIADIFKDADNTE